MTTRQMLFLIPLVWLLITIRPAAAENCPSATTPEVARTEGVRIFHEGHDHLEAERPGVALRDFRCSYSLLARRETLRQIGLTHQLIGNTSAALETFLTYLEIYPDAPDRTEIQIQIDRLRQAGAGQEISEADEDDPLPRVPMLTIGQIRPARIVRRTTRPRIAGWTLFAMAIAFAGTTVGFLVAASVVHDDFEIALANQIGCDTHELSALADRGQAFGIAGWLSLLGSLSSGLFGLLVFEYGRWRTVPEAQELDHREDHRSQRRVGLQLGFGGLGLQGTF